MIGFLWHEFPTYLLETMKLAEQTWFFLFVYQVKNLTEFFGGLPVHQITITESWYDREKSNARVLFSWFPYTPQSLQVSKNWTNLLENRKVVFKGSLYCCPGRGAIRKWPLIRPNPTLTVCSQTKITAFGIWFERTIVWSEVTSVWQLYDQRSLPSGHGMIIGHFRMGMVWSEADSSAH